MDIHTIGRVHFIGIGGIGMSALARLFVYDGKKVSGSDGVQTENTEKLIAEGVEVMYEQVAENITDGIDLVVYTEAMASDHPELEASRNKGITTINYFEALGLVANQYYLIAVAGTHGKTTTTAMLADIFEVAGLDPTVIVGSLRSKTGSNYQAGKSKYAIVEACEYKRDFLHLEPDVLVITNIELEHVDYYKDLADVQDAFRTLAQKVPEAGVIIADTTNKNILPVLSDVQASIVDYRTCVDPLLNLKQPGLHNLMNAAAGIAVAMREGILLEVAKTALEEFNGTWRRFEYKGVIHGAPVYDDYSHHPTEVVAAIDAARTKHPDKNLTIIFQPHTYSRTKGLFDDFVAALTKADRVILAPIYAARTEDVADVSSDMLSKEICKQGGKALFLETNNEIVEEVRNSVSENDVVMVVGAGNVTEIASILTESK